MDIKLAVKSFFKALGVVLGLFSIVGILVAIGCFIDKLPPEQGAVVFISIIILAASIFTGRLIYKNDKGKL